MEPGHGFRQLSPRHGLMLPEYEDRNIVNLLPSIGRLVGLGGHRPPAKIWGVLQELEGCEKVLVILLDGLGHDVMRRLIEGREGRWLKGLMAKGGMIPITTVFPSTTPSAMISFCTGLPPRRHGVAGYNVYLKEVGAVVNMIDFSPAIEQRREALAEAGIDPRGIVKVPTLFERMRQGGIGSLILTRRPLKDSSLSRICHRGAEALPYHTLAEMAARLRKLVEQDRRSQVVYAYWDGFDAVGHIHGPDSEEAWAEARCIVAALAQNLRGKGRVGVVITADHGQDTVEREGQVDLQHDQTLQGLLAIPPTGDAKATILHAAPQGRRRLQQYIRRFSRVSLILPSEKALELGLLGRGRTHPALRDRLGQYILLCRPGYAFHYRHRVGKQEPHLRGLHGSLSSRELLIPLLAGRL